jgi:MoxR-like ATPase
MENTLKPLLQKLDHTEKKIEERIHLPAVDSWPETFHVFDTKSLWAIKACLAAERPLLVRGEPGTGKSQLARAAAHVLDRCSCTERV